MLSRRIGTLMIITNAYSIHIYSNSSISPIHFYCSFSFTNAHLILNEARENQSDNVQNKTPFLLISLDECH